MPNTYIIGHSKPDTDAVVAALALQFLVSKEAYFGYSETQVVIADPLNLETTYLFERFQQEIPPLLTDVAITNDDQFVLVDHNEASQRSPLVPESQIIEIIDHHKLHLSLTQPIFVTSKPWGSTTTIIHYLMEQNGVEPDRTLSGLMLAAILSDTVGLQSATTTVHDEQSVEKLAKIAKIEDVKTFTLDIFKAKSSVGQLTPKQIVLNDYKVFDFGKKVFINQIETVEQTELLSQKKADLLETMADVKQEMGLDLLFVVVTDILKLNSKIVVLSEDERLIAEEAFGGTVANNILDIGPKLSRKKEIAPAIEKVLTKK